MKALLGFLMVGITAGCSANSNPGSSGGNSAGIGGIGKTGGSTAAGTTASDGSSGATGLGGSQDSGGAWSQGGRSASGGLIGAGGTVTSGNDAGPNGGGTAAGGNQGGVDGGSTATGGIGGGVQGGGGIDAAGGSPGTGGGTTCGVPTGFKWSSSGQLIVSDSAHVSIKDPSVVRYGGLWHVFASQVDSSGNYSITYLNFSDWSEASSAKQTKLTVLGNTYRAAPQVFYFKPQSKWYLIYDGGPSYSVSSDISQPSGWSAPATLASNGPSGWLDHWVICDTVNCYLFGSADDGKWYRNQTTLAKFPGGWGTYTVVMQSSDAGSLYEASNVYKMKGTDQYLALIEAFDSSSNNKRYFRSWTAKTLDGTWTALADTYSNPFASASNVSFSGTPWTSDISHGEMIRDGYDESLTIDTCQLQYLYQGIPPGLSVSYNALPWKLGLLTLSP